VTGDRRTSTATRNLDVVAAFARALDADDFDALLPMLADDVVYRIGDSEHHGPTAVVRSYRSGSELARQLFDVVAFSHEIVGPIADRTVRIDFVDMLRVGDDQLIHHSIQDIQVDVVGRIVTIDDVPIDGERERVDAFLTRHDLTRGQSPTDS
jgi:limonene-1,2-epoxide hydrolase